MEFSKVRIYLSTICGARADVQLKDLNAFGWEGLLLHFIRLADFTPSDLGVRMQSNGSVEFRTLKEKVTLKHFTHVYIEIVLLGLAILVLIYCFIYFF